MEDERHFLVECDLYKDVRGNALEMWNKEITQDKNAIFRSLIGGLKVNKAKEVLVSTPLDSQGVRTTPQTRQQNASVPAVKV